MLQMGYFVFYGAPIKIETEKWRMDSISNGDDTSTIEIIKYNYLGNRAWSFRIIREEDKLKAYPLVCTSDDYIGKIIYHMQTLSDSGLLKWSDINSMFYDIIIYLDE